MKMLKYVEICCIVLGVFLVVLFFCGNCRPQKTVKKKNIKNETEVYVDIVADKKTTKKKQLQPKLNKPQVEQPKQSKEKQQKNAGELPPISANYRKYVGFDRYSHEMNKLGCRFFIISENSKYLYEINFGPKNLTQVGIEELADGTYSGKSRAITDEAGLKDYLNIAEKKYNLLNPEVIMLVPVKYDAYLANCIMDSQIFVDKVSTLKGYYNISNNQMWLNLNEALYDSGEKKTINMKIQLFQ